MASPLLPYQVVNDADAADHLFELVDGVNRSHCLYMVCDLGIQDIVMKSPEPISLPKIVEQLTQDVDVDILRRIMRYISSHGVFRECLSDAGELCFGPTKITELICSYKPSSLYAMMMHSCSPWVSLTDLNRSRILKKEVRADNLFETVNGVGFWEYLHRNERDRIIFNQFMDDASKKAGVAIIPVLAAEIKAGSTVLDIAGGSGRLMQQLKALRPDLRCINLDVPEVLAQFGQVDGVEMVVGDMFKAETIPKADVIVLKHIIHNWGDEKSLDILFSCRQALPVGGKLMCVESLLDDPGQVTAKHHHNLSVDQRMMILFGSRERCGEEMAVLYGKSGFALEKIIALNNAGIVPLNSLSVVVGLKLE